MACCFCSSYMHIMCTYIYTYLHACIRIHIHTYIIYVCIQPYKRNIPVNKHTYIRKYIHVHTYTCTLTDMYVMV